MEKKYTAEDLHIAFVAGGLYQKPQAGTKVDVWRRAAGAVEEENRPGNRGIMKTPDFEKEFETSMQIVRSERS